MGTFIVTLTNFGGAIVGTGGFAAVLVLSGRAAKMYREQSGGVPPVNDN